MASAARKLHTPRLNSLQGKCFSTSSVVEWKEMDVVAEVTEMIDYTEFVKASISVRAFLWAQVEPPDAVLRFGNTYPWTIGLGAISESDISYMVVFNYGSVILLNVGDSQVNEHLEIVKVHASDVDVTSLWPPVDRDLLPEDAPLS
ncbi:hypothetical protein CTI12_AA414450 [Artemisia annua]|uniref:Uncharacterized protein n=1 Tax=Artemisia annua TaxID=35608 RepID=A0A2U1M699_ARTAN|nr:hypothetical protein CTI12_AA414450 [Artemisia annua]